MSSFYSRGPSDAFLRGAYGLALTLPLLAVSAQSKSTNITTSSLEVSAQFKKEFLADSKAPRAVEGNRTRTRSPKSTTLGTKDEEPRVLITEVIIKGLADHPQKDRLQIAAYDAMRTRPGMLVNRAELKLDLDSIYSTGWFSGVRVEPVNGPLGVQIVVQVEPNPLLTRVQLQVENSKVPQVIIDEIFASDYGQTINLNDLQVRIKKLRDWYRQEGYSLSRIVGPNRITSKGVVYLKVVEGTVAGVEIKFLNKEGDIVDEKGKPIKGKTKKWVITREISIKPGETFNRNQLESDIKRIYKTSLFSDVKVTLKPVAGEPGKIIIVLGIIEQQTGSLSGGIGYSQSQGIFGQVGVQDTNLLGKSWNSSFNLTYGQYGGLANITFSNPWINDNHRTSLRTSLFLSREVPQAFRSSDGGTIRGVSDFYNGNSSRIYDIDSTSHGQGKFDSVVKAKSSFPGKSWFDYEGNAVALQRTGGSFIVSRPLNGGDPYKEVPWSVLLGMNIQKVRPIDFSGKSRPYGASTGNFKNGSVPDDEVICIAFNCAEENSLFGIRAAATYNNLNNRRNPTSGNFLSLGTEQFFSIGENSPTFNRARVSYTKFVPVNWLKIAKGCRPKPGEKANCPQAIGFQVKAGTAIGELPPYEAFCLGGSNSVRGWSSCDLAVGRSFGEASIEYRFPIWKIVSGELFVDSGTDFGSQANVPGKPGKLLNKPGSGFSLGTGLIITTPVGPLRLEAASKDLEGDWRFSLGVGWKF